MNELRCDCHPDARPILRDADKIPRKGMKYTTRQSTLKRRIKCNAWGNWHGYEGTKRVASFGETTQHTAEQNAQRWLNEDQSAIASNF